MSDYTIGIDPGVTGAMAMIHDGRVVRVDDIPTYEHKVGKRIQNVLNAALLARTITSWCKGRNVMIWVEQTQIRGGSGRIPGVTSVFSSGRTFGIIEGVIATLGCPVQYIHPNVWKTSHRLQKKTKDDSIARAIELYPHAIEDLARKKDHGRAEAILIAHYGAVAALLAPV